MKKRWIFTVILILVMVVMVGCDSMEASSGSNGTKQDANRTMNIAANLQAKQPTPTDIEYSLERYNLIRRAYWVNGQRDKAKSYPCPLPDMPLGYAVLLTQNGSVVGKFIVQGKLSSLQNYLTPVSQWYEQEYWGDGDSANGANKWLADVDGTYGDNDDGVFFFTPEGYYIEWSGDYLYSDIPFDVADPVVTYKQVGGN